MTKRTAYYLITILLFWVLSLALIGCVASYQKAKSSKTENRHTDMKKLNTKTFHAETNSLEYRTWRSIKQRCHNPKSSHYSYYGARGIAVCKRWFESFENFLADMGRKPTVKHTIDRIKNNLGYSPSNCRWATRLEQMNNTRWNVFIEHNGEKKSVQQWSRDLKIHYKTITYRLRNNWPPSEVLSSPYSVRHEKV